MLIRIGRVWVTRRSVLVSITRVRVAGRSMLISIARVQVVGGGVLVRLALVGGVVGSVAVASFLLVVRLVLSRCDSGGISHVAGTSVVELVGVRVLGQVVGIVVDILVLAAEELAEDTAAALGVAGAGGVVVLGTGAEALLLLVVAGEGPFDEDGEDEEETVEVSS